MGDSWWRLVHDEGISWRSTLKGSSVQHHPTSDVRRQRHHRHPHHYHHHHQFRVTFASSWLGKKDAILMQINLNLMLETINKSPDPTIPCPHLPLVPQIALIWRCGKLRRHGEFKLGYRDFVDLFLFELLHTPIGWRTFQLGVLWKV